MGVILFEVEASNLGHLFPSLATPEHALGLNFYTRPICDAHQVGNLGLERRKRLNVIGLTRCIVRPRTGTRYGGFLLGKEATFMSKQPLTLETVAQALRAPFPPGQEQYRLGPTWEADGERWGRPLLFIDARTVFDRLDAAVGPGGWETHLERLGTGVYLCRLTVLGVSRSDVGIAGENESEKEKAGASDAIKRAAVQFGIGRYLYDLDLPPVKLEMQGKDWRLPQRWRPPSLSMSGNAPSTDNTVTFSRSKTGAVTKKQIAKSAVEMSRVGWSDEDGRAHLQRVYHKRSRLELTAAEASEFIDYLVGLPSKSTAL
jgi:hypothetical protein